MKTVTRLNRKAAKKLQRQACIGTGIGGVAVALTALSLTHLAHGFAIVCHAEGWEAWAMAVGVDLGFIGLELASILAATVHVRRQIEVYSKPAVIGTLIGSALMNSFGFAAGTESYLALGAAVAAGCAIPALIYVLTKVGATLYIDCHTRGAS